MTGNHIYNILICRITLQGTLEIRTILTGRFLFPLPMGIHIQQEIFRIVHPGYTCFLLRIVSGTQHDIDLIRHRDITHTAHRAPGIEIFDITVGTTFEQILIILDIIRVEIRRPREITDLCTDPIQITFGILKLMEHIARNQFYRTDPLEVIPQPFQDKSGDHFRLPYPTIPIDLDNKNTTVVFFHGKQRTVTRITADLFNFFIDHRQTWFLDIPEIIYLLFQRRNDRLDVPVRPRYIEIPDLRERNQLFGSPQKTDHIRDKPGDIFDRNVFGIIQPVVIGQVFHISLLENHQLLHHAMFHHLTAIIVRIHIGDKPGQTTDKKRRIGPQIQ